MLGIFMLLLNPSYTQTTTTELTSFNRQGTVGVGIGIPYGIFGINGEFFILSQLSLTAGVGSTLFAGLGYSAGVNYYLRKDSRRKWQPKLSLHYGINGMIINADYLEYSQKYAGVTVGLGQVWLLGAKQRSGLDLALMIVATSGVYDAAKERLLDPPLPVRLSVGYKYAF